MFTAEEVREDTTDPMEVQGEVPAEVPMETTPTIHRTAKVLRKSPMHRKAPSAAEAEDSAGKTFSRISADPCLNQ